MEKLHTKPIVKRISQHVVGARRCPNFTFTLEVSSQRRSPASIMLSTMEKRVQRYLAVLLLICIKYPFPSTLARSETTVRCASCRHISVSEHLWKLLQRLDRLLRQPHAEKTVRLSQLAEQNLDYITIDFCDCFSSSHEMCFSCLHWITRCFDCAWLSTWLLFKLISIFTSGIN